LAVRTGSAKRTGGGRKIRFVCSIQLLSAMGHADAIRSRIGIPQLPTDPKMPIIRTVDGTGMSVVS